MPCKSHEEEASALGTNSKCAPCRRTGVLHAKHACTPNTTKKNWGTHASASRRGAPTREDVLALPAPPLSLPIALPPPLALLQLSRSLSLSRSPSASASASLSLGLSLGL
eukprot:3161437-Pleurochrysis_carterae.AAC.1